ncbi:hypothetical protein [Kitasatospora sp. NPDC094015]|uniref:hypothetical protein n=1 Tax=Kitasatospora sp. NPDC094015 TaxID=3155205 RepID=UPI00331CB496
MRSGLVQLGAWTAATGAAVVLSWLGVHSVLAGTVFEQPTAVPLPSAAAPSPTPEAASAPPTASSTEAPAPAGSSAPPSTRSAAPSRTPGPRPSPSASVQSYLVPGGRVALDLRADRAELISATPDPGWKMQVWNEREWMRIDFSHPDGTSSVFVTWNGHPPIVQTVPAP